MITLTISEQDGRQYRVRYQTKTAQGWADSEVQTITGTSQPFGIDKGSSRLILEDVSGVALNAEEKLA